MDLMQRRRELMMGGQKKEYVSVFKSIFPSNGAVSGRKNFFLYLTETLSVGAKVHLALDFTALDSTAQYLDIRDTEASAPDIRIPLAAHIDVEFEVSDRATNVFYCYFDVSVSGVQINLTTIKLEK